MHVTRTQHKEEKMVLSQDKRAIGTFSHRADAEYAIKELNSAGFLIKQISVLTTDANREEQLGGDGMSDRVWLKALDNTATCATVTGSMLGAIGRCLIGLGLLAVPGVGLIVAVATSQNGSSRDSRASLVSAQ
jgi:hypothetical protein